MKWYNKTFVFMLVTILTVLGGTVNFVAAESVIMDNNIIPAEGFLFLPNSMATRGTVVMALYNLAENRIIQGTGSDGGLQGNGAANGVSQGFSDVPKDSPYYIAASFCASKGYVNGYPGGTFKPEGFITRAEMCAVLSRFLSLSVDGQATLPPPPDLPAGHWASGFIFAVIRNGIMSGYVDKTFKPENMLTRAELATILVNAKHLSQPRYILEFDDVPKTHWAYKYVTCVSAPPIRNPSPVETEVAKLVNALRAGARCGELRLDTFLCEVARAKARDMIDNSYFNHISPNWGSPEEMLKTFGVAFYYMGENIALGEQTPAEVVARWADSSAHYQNMLSDDYHKAGIGCVTRNDGTTFWVMVFVG